MPRSPSKWLEVSVDGKRCGGRSSVDRFIAALERIGFDEVGALGIEISDWPIVGRTTPDEMEKYRYCRGWWVRTCLSNAEKHSILERIRRRMPDRQIVVTLMDVREELLA
jgi:hypothetical protein